MADDQLTKELRYRLAEYLGKAHGIDIPNPGESSHKPFHCLNPRHQDDNPSMYYYISKTRIPRVKCQSCGEDYGIFDLVHEYNKDCNTLTKQKARAMEILSVTGSPSQAYTKNKRTAHPDSGASLSPKGLIVGELPEKQVRVFTDEEYAEWHGAVDMTTYFTDRGLTADTIERFNLGYIHDRDPLRCLAIIPCTMHSCVARYIKPGDGRPKYHYFKDSQLDLFNVEELNQVDEPVFIVEGAIDALSVIQLGFRCVGMNSLGGKNKLKTAIEERMPNLPHLIMMLDNDKKKSDPKKQRSVDLAKQSVVEVLTTLNIAFTMGKIPDPYKDTNEMLLSDSGALQGLLGHYYDLALETPPDTHPLEEENMVKKDTNQVNETNDKLTPSGSANSQDEMTKMEKEKVERTEAGWFKSINIAKHLENFFTRSKPEITFSTGFPRLDEALGDDGIHEGLIGLGSQNGQGKTTFALQIADHVARNGQHVVFFSLEQSADELIAKLISLHTTGKDISKNSRGMTYKQVRRHIAQKPLELEGGDDPIKVFNQAFDIVSKTNIVGDDGYKIDNTYLHIVEGFKTAREIETDIWMIQQMYGETPLVIVDQLQRIKPPDKYTRDATEVVKYNVGMLKDISRRFGTAVVVLSMMNRASYGYDMSEASFRDASDIEFTCDVQLGIQFRQLKDKSDDLKDNKLSTLEYNELERAYPREMHMKIMKNRWGEKGIWIEYDFFTKYSRFKELPKENRITDKLLSGGSR